MAKSSKPATKTAEPRLIPQPNGRGALLSGGKPGNSGGRPGRSGRKPAPWREQCARALVDSDAVRVLERMVAGDGEAKPRDQLGGTVRRRQ